MSRLPAPFQLLELNVISAQDLSPVSRSMRTYAVAWIHPDRKLSTRVDTHGHKNPTWNDKFVFRVDEDFLYADTSAIMIDIYALHWFKDIHVGSVRVLIANLIPYPRRNNPSSGMRFGALQVRRPSGRPQGILNIGVAVLDSSMRSMPLYTHNPSAVGYRHLMGEKDAYEYHNHMSPRHVSKPELRRTKSDTSSMISARQQRLRGTRGKPSSALSSSEANSKKSSRRKSRSRSRASSRVSGSEVSEGGGKFGKPTSVLSEPGAGRQWRAKFERPDSMLSGSDLSEKPIMVKSTSPSRNVKDSDVIDHKSHKLQAPESLTTQSETTDDTPDTTEKFNAFENQRLFHKTNDVYEVKASPKQQFRNSPGPKLLQTPPVGFGGSHKNTPMHPTAGYGGSRKNTPMHPTVGYGGSHKNTPLHQAVGYGGSRKATPKGTPLHSIGKFNPALEYATPRRSNLGGIAPPVITESELGPSPSEVAAALAKNPKIDEGENSTVGGWSLDESVEGLQSKLERWRTELPPVYDRGELSSYPASTKSKKSMHNRRHTDGGNGLFSCFSNLCGCECSIVCGGDNSKKKAAGRRRTPSADDASFL
ncbi:uncharacterized protein LOC129310158 [Prosopis cineraria]|uniref:uncharacterized protein LOC129310158 n=1 Tax=Prosopis cineraria TaxID=364024 RepID=UPI0024105CF9|nr:uncharacterized protein LOC129310158 [Prosopis cineraria]